jgi:Holliday junction resolvasome RuvABC DNA-binding subunit
MATIKQRKLAENIVENAKRTKPLNKKELVVSSGYGEISAKSSAHIIIDQKGVKDSLQEMGFDSENAKRVVAEILNKPDAQDKDRLKAADMIFDVHGDKAPEKHLVVTRKIISVDE